MRIFFLNSILIVLGNIIILLFTPESGLLYDEISEVIPSNYPQVFFITVFCIYAIVIVLSLKNNKNIARYFHKIRYVVRSKTLFWSFINIAFFTAIFANFTKLISYLPSKYIFLKYAIFCALILVCLTGISLGAYGLSKLNPREDLFEYIYEKRVRQISEYLTLAGGALLFFWIL